MIFFLQVLYLFSLFRMCFRLSAAHSLINRAKLNSSQMHGQLNPSRPALQLWPWAVIGSFDCLATCRAGFITLQSSSESKRGRAGFVTVHLKDGGSHTPRQIHTAAEGLFLAPFYEQEWCWETWFRCSATKSPCCLDFLLWLVSSYVT